MKALEIIALLIIVMIGLLIMIGIPKSGQPIMDNPHKSQYVVMQNDYLANDILHRNKRDACNHAADLIAGGHHKGWVTSDPDTHFEPVGNPDEDGLYNRWANNRITFYLAPVNYIENLRSDDRSGADTPVTNSA